MSDRTCLTRKHLCQGAQMNMVGLDTPGAWIFAGFGLMVAPDVIVELVGWRYGWGVGPNILQVLGKETLGLEREFNRQAAFTRAPDRIPECIRTEPLSPRNSVFDVPEAALAEVFNW